MSPWKCPHCGTPQAESARCWACKRSPLACSTCRDFRRSVAGRLGYCGLDRSRKVLTGDEVRSCWTAPGTPAEAPLVGLFGGLEPAPATRAIPIVAGPPAPAPASEPVPIVEAPSAALPWEAPTTADVAPAPAAANQPGPASDRDPATAAPPPAAPPSAAPRSTKPRPPAPTAHEAAQRRWDALVADIAKGLPLGSDPAGGAIPSVPARPAAGSTPIVPWLASNAHLVAATGTATATPPTGTPTEATGTQLAPRASVVPGSAEWTATVPQLPPLPPMPPITPPAPWEPPVTTTYPYPVTSDEPSPTEAIRWRHRAADDPLPPAPADDPSTTTRRTPAFSLIPATLANRLRRHLGTRGPREDAVTPPDVATATSAMASASLTGTSPRVTAPITANRPGGHGLIEAPPVAGTIMSLGDQLRRAEQLRRERALLDGQRLGGEGGGETPT